MREVGGESFAEPEMRETFFRGMITEPLVHDLVRLQVLFRPVTGYGVFKIKDGTRVFHAAKHGLGLHIGQFLISIRADIIFMPGQDIPRDRKIMKSFLPVFWKNPGAYRDTITDRTRLLYGKFSYPDHHYFGRQWHFFFPVCKFKVARPVAFFYLYPVRHHLVMRRGCYNEINGRLICRVIPAGQPVMRPVGPVVGKKGSFPEFVFRYDQPVGRNTGISNVES